MNLFVGIGNLTRDPEMKYTSQGKAYTKFTIAIDSSRKDDGPLFVDCTTWEKQAETAAEYLRKGNKCAVTGEIRMDSWEDPTGAKRTKWYCNVRHVEFLTPPQRGERQGPEGGLPF